MLRSLALASVLLCVSAMAATYHIAPTGSDKNPGSVEAPLASLQKAAEIVEPGDTVVLHEGTYPLAQEIHFRKSGREGNWITFRSADGEHAVLDASLAQMRPDLPRNGYVGALELAGVSWLRFIGIELRDCWAFGFRIGGENTHHIELLNCKVDRSYCSGIWLGKSDYCRVIGCEITHANDIDARLPGTRRPGEAPQEAISIAQARHFEVAYNRVHKCYKEGIDCKETSSHGTIHDNEVYQIARQGLYVDCWFGVLEDVEWYNNVAHDCEWGFALSAEGKGASMRSIRFHHNTIYNNRASGIFFGRWGVDGPRSQLWIYNNTIRGNGSTEHWAGSTGGIDVRAHNIKDVVIANNIVCNNSAFEIATFADEGSRAQAFGQRNITIANNLTSPFHDNTKAGGMFNHPYPFAGDNTLIGEPHFYDPRIGDFRLYPDSPGLNLARPDLIPFPTTPDIGAHGPFKPMP
jgi:Right handed beta helix region/Pel9A-like, right handed beta helix region